MIRTSPLAPGCSVRLRRVFAARWPAGLSGVVLITDERVQDALGDRARDALAALAMPLKATLTVPAGEASKSLAQAGALYEQLAACRRGSQNGDHRARWRHGG